MFRIQRAQTVRVNLVLRQQVANGVIRKRGDFIDFMRSAEAVEEMDKRHPALKRGDMGNQRKVLGFLDAAGAQHGATGLAHGHDVGMVAED